MQAFSFAYLSLWLRVGALGLITGVDAYLHWSWLRGSPFEVMSHPVSIWQLLCWGQSSYRDFGSATKRHEKILCTVTMLKGKASQGDHGSPVRIEYPLFH